MKNLILSETETKELEQDGSVEIIRNGFNILVEKNCNSWEIETNPYTITIVNPFEKVILKKQKKVQKLEIGKVYKVSWGRHCFYGEYIGLFEDEQGGVHCSICGEEDHKKGHQFNSFYGQNDCDYETFTIGTTCIKKCKIEQSSREEMLLN